LAQEKVCECFNVDFFQAIKLFYGYALRAYPKIQAWRRRRLLKNLANGLKVWKRWQGLFQAKASVFGYALIIGKQAALNPKTRKKIGESFDEWIYD
jgi:hypothetical protein